MKYFSYSEFEKSEIAELRGIDNTIPDEYKENIAEFVENLLDPLREAWGSGIRVTSGYRSEPLNRALNGSKTSAHTVGYAADIQPINGKMKEFQEFVEAFIKDYEWDQCIRERVKCGCAQWIHLSYKNRQGLQRRQCFTLI